MTIFLGEFTNLKDVTYAFRIKPSTLNGCVIHLAFYEDDEENYSGYAFVLLEKGGSLFEVNAYHCSCFGLEEQWELEETSKEALLHRIKASPNCFRPYKQQLLKILELL